MPTSMALWRWSYLGPTLLSVSRVSLLLGARLDPDLRLRRDRGRPRQEFRENSESVGGAPAPVGEGWEHKWDCNG